MSNLAQQNKSAFNLSFMSYAECLEEAGEKAALIALDYGLATYEWADGSVSEFLTDEEMIFNYGSL